MQPATQVKLLRVLQERTFRRLGGRQEQTVDVRIIAATNQDLAARVAERTFRDDLYYRLSVFPIRIPPLRERPADIPLIARHLAFACAKRIGRRVTGIADEALEALTSYCWPGNVRELQNVVERAVILAASGIITPESIRLDRLPSAAPSVAAADASPGRGTAGDPRGAAAGRRARQRALGGGRAPGIEADNPARENEAAGDHTPRCPAGWSGVTDHVMRTRVSASRPSSSAGCSSIFSSSIPARRNGIRGPGWGSP
jgi:transcriptional regulator with GAF, ATPase, and Fis domain